MSAIIRASGETAIQGDLRHSSIPTLNKWPIQSSNSSLSSNGSWWLLPCWMLSIDFWAWLWWDWLKWSNNNSFCSLVVNLPHKANDLTWYLLPSSSSLRTSPQCIVSLSVVGNMYYDCYQHWASLCIHWLIQDKCCGSLAHHFHWLSIHVYFFNSNKPVEKISFTAFFLSWTSLTEKSINLVLSDHFHKFVILPWQHKPEPPKLITIEYKFFE